MGAGADAFPETAWSSILAAPDSPERRERLNQLCTSYWRPIYRFIRAWGQASVEDSKDLAQAFFEAVLEDDLFSKYRPERGSLRNFLKASLRHFLANAHRDETRLKRGGGRRAVSIESDIVDDLGDPRQETPEEAFDRQWADDLFARAIDRLRAALAAEGKEIYFRVYEAYDLGGGEAPTQHELAGRLGIPRHAVENHLQAARSRLKAILIEELTPHVLTREQLAQELREALGGE